jgi:predicted Zn-dependent protease
MGMVRSENTPSPEGSRAWSRSAYLMARDSVDAVMVLTQAAQQINDVTDATVAFRLALADHPRNRALHRSYAAMLTSVGDSVSARRELALGNRR